MTAVVLNEVHKGFYLDSVALMRLSRTIAAMPGVDEAALMMGTPANREILGAAGLLAEAGQEAGGGDLLICVRAANESAAQAALAEATAQLTRPRTQSGEAGAWRPRTMRAAVDALRGATLALISVPGEFAAAEARKAIRRGLDAMIFSDNVALEDEVALKREARALGRLVMGPDCGTAIIGGTPLAFANAVPRGNVGIVGASGTGIQEVSCLIAQMGGGISHAIGVGGRDLSAEVGGISTLMALDALERDPGTERIVLISKPPAPDVAAAVLGRLTQGGKPAIVCFIGADPMEMPANAAQVFSLKSAARAAIGLSPDTMDDAASTAPAIALPGGRRKILGLYSGGTLCAEAQVLFRAAGEEVSSNAPIPGASRDGAEHSLLDLGDDAYTKGRPHPMIDPEVRDAPLADALGRDDLAVILVDLVIGYGAHEDPAGRLAACAGTQAGAGAPVLIASVTGTEADPQRRSAQVAKLEAAGAIVAPSNADAAAWALAAIGARG